MFGTRRVIPGRIKRTPLISLFTGPGDDVAVARYDYSGSLTEYWLHQHLGRGMYWSLRTERSVWASTEDYARLDQALVQRIVRWFNKVSTPAATFSAGWGESAVPGLAGYMGGYVYYVSGAGEYAQIVMPAGATWLGIEYNQGANAGLGKITIDGDATLADLLPTAQDVVTSGAYANTILVANGGTLNPTDRVIDFYTGAAYCPYLTKSLSTASHTVRLTSTGYKRAASSGINLLLHCFYGYGPNYCKTSNANYWMLLEPGQTIMAAALVWEISWNIVPTGGVTQWWVGHSGSLKYISLAITVNGATVTPTNGQTFSGTEIKFITQQSVRATEINGGATQLGLLNLTYTMNATTGLTIDHDLTWSSGGSLYPSFPCMCATDEIFDRVRADGEPVAVLTDNDDSAKADTSKYVLFSWDYNGYAAIAFSPDPDLACGRWVNNAGPTGRFWWKDLNGWNKAYVLPRTVALPYSAPDVFRSSANYRVQWFPGGANAALGG